MKPRMFNTSIRSQQGVALLEALIAVLLISFGVLGIIGIQAASISAISEARYRIEATALADELINQVWIDTTTANALPAYVDDAAALPEAWLNRVYELPGAADNPPTISSTTNNVITLTIRWQPPNGSLHQHRIVTSINRNPAT